MRSLLPPAQRAVAALAAIAYLFLAAPVFADPLAGYSNYEAFTAQVRELDQSEFLAVRSLVKTAAGREVWLLTVGGSPSEKADAKPAIFVTGQFEPANLAAGELVLRLARELAARADKGDQPTLDLLAKNTFYFVPRPDPDGTEKCFAKPSREPTGNARHTDDDRDFHTGEDPPDDLNGDGWITQMRVAALAGTLIEHPDDPRILIEADPKKNERGKWRLLTEGQDDDRDEQWNEDAADGVALGKNFTFQYKPFQQGTGPNAVSEAETRALVDFLHDRPNIAVVYCISPLDNLFHVWKPNPQAQNERIKRNILSADAPGLEWLAEKYRKQIGGEEPPAASDPGGSFPSWAYYHYGRWSLAGSAWHPPKTAAPAAAPKPGPPQPEPEEGDAPREKPAEPKKPSGEKRGADELSRLYWLEKHKLPGFVDWKPIEHPDFPGKRVEIGGFKPFYLLNPPAAELPALAAKRLEFLTAIPQQLPRLELADLKATALGGGVIRIEATVVNQGYLATMPEMGEVNRIPYPLQIELTGLPEKTVWIDGVQRSRLPRLSGAGGKTERTWLVRVPGDPPASLHLRAWAPAVGEAAGETKIK